MPKSQPERMAIPWKESWVQLNTNGAVKMETNNATFEGVLRDHEGKSMLGFNICLGKCSVFDAKLWGI